MKNEPVFAGFSDDLDLVSLEHGGSVTDKAAIIKLLRWIAEGGTIRAGDFDLVEMVEMQCPEYRSPCLVQGGNVAIFHFKEMPERMLAGRTMAFTEMAVHLIIGLPADDVRIAGKMICHGLCDAA